MQFLTSAIEQNRTAQPPTVMSRTLLPCPQVVRPSAFDSFKNFVWWRETVTSAVWLILSQATRDHWLASPASAIEGQPSARSLLARCVGVGVVWRARLGG